MQVKPFSMYLASQAGPCKNKHTHEHTYTHTNSIETWVVYGVYICMGAITGTACSMAGSVDEA